MRRKRGIIERMQALLQRSGSRKKNTFLWKSAKVSTYTGETTKSAFLAHTAHEIRRFTGRLKKGKSYLCRAEVRRKYIFRFLKTSAALAGVIGLVMVLKAPVFNALATLDFFKIKEIEVIGCRVTAPDDIKHIAGARFNDSLYHFSITTAEKNLNQSAWVRDAEVKRLWPDGVEIRIREYTAAAILVAVREGREQLVYVDRKGTVIDEVRPGDEVDYPIITGAADFTSQDHEALMGEATEFLQLIGKNDPNLPAQSVSEIHLDAEEGMTVHLVDHPFPIYFGKGEVKKKYKQLRSILAVLYKKRNQKVDMENIDYIRMNYGNDKVLVAQQTSG